MTKPAPSVLTGPFLTGPVLIVGVRSDIARALARAYAAQGCNLILAARDAARLAADKADLEVRYQVSVQTAECDLLAIDPDAFLAGLGAVPGTVVMVAGLLGDQAVSASQDAEARLVMATNYAAPARLLLAAARIMQSGSCIIGISSVAGDRGRASNYIYGSAKAGFTAFLSGLRASLAGKGIHVLTVKPGFVATAMTEGLKLPPVITGQPEAVAADIIKAQAKGRDVIYTLWMWRWIMLIIRSIPEKLFKKLSL